MNPIDRYAHLWDGSEPGWVLLRVNRQTLVLSITFDQKGPEVHQVKAIREAVPTYKALSSANVLAQLRGMETVQLGEFESMEGRRIAEACRKQGLTVQENALDRSGFLPFNEQTKAALVIEDELLSRQVTEEALRRGLPIRHVEA